MEKMTTKTIRRSIFYFPEALSLPLIDTTSSVASFLSFCALNKTTCQFSSNQLLLSLFLLFDLLPAVNQALWRIKVIKEMMLWWFQKIKGVLEYDDLELMTPLSPGLWWLYAQPFCHKITWCCNYTNSLLQGS